MRVLVTGAAGFIGSNLCEALLIAGHEVVGVDSFVPNYPEPKKRANLMSLVDYDTFTFIEAAVEGMESSDYPSGIDVVCHLAGLPGVRTSWDPEQFSSYVKANVVGTQAVLGHALQADVAKFVYASSSSVYGGATSSQSLSETQLPRPTSPYAVTKLSGEHLCSLYGSELGLDTLSLRFFTVFGPRQRPDMAMHRMINSALTGQPFTVFGDGKQERDFTFVGDIVRAIMLSLSSDVPKGSVLNVGGGAPVGLLDVVQHLEGILNRPVPLQFVDRGPGDPAVTRADVTLVRQALGWRPQTSLIQGLSQQVEWQVSRATQ